jgi:hypothetical protein
MKNVSKILVESMKGRDSLGNPGVDRRVTVKLILKK